MRRTFADPRLRRPLLVLALLAVATVFTVLPSSPTRTTAAGETPPPPPPDAPAGAQFTTAARGSVVSVTFPSQVLTNAQGQVVDLGGIHSCGSFGCFAWGINWYFGYYPFPHEVIQGCTLGDLENDAMGDLRKGRRAIVKVRVQQVGRVQVHEKKGFFVLGLEAFDGALPNPTAEVVEAAQSFGGLQDRAGMRKRGLLRPHQALVARRLLRPAIDDGLVDHRERIERAVQAGVETRAIARKDRAAETREGGSPAALAEAIRLRVGAETGVRLRTVVLLRAGTLLKTSSGKVRRNASRLQFENDELGDGLLFAG